MSERAYPRITQAFGGIGLAVTVFAMIGLGCAHRGLEPSRSRLGTLVVKVVDEHGAGVEDARVSLEGVTQETLTQRAGHYWFAQLLSGAYIPVVVTKFEKVQFREAVRVREGRITEVELTVPDSALRPPPHQLPPPAASVERRTGTIQGTVMSVDERALQFANVIVIGAQTGGQTDRSGRFVVRNVPIGAYRVRVRMVGFRQEDRDSVRVREGATTTVDFKLSPQAVKVSEQVDREPVGDNKVQLQPGRLVETRTGTIRGTIVDEYGHALRWANVLLPGVLISGPTDDSGHFFLQVPIGFHSLRVVMRGFNKVERESVRVSAGDTTTVDFKLHPIE